ncbi:MAG: hypothetical protein HQL24_04650 [Candidatus Omnitrophica bacterium]|nr:hypothetical protein [Candidatus Omnitrophota bacterium]
MNKINYKNVADQALEVLFNDKNHLGFWDDKRHQLYGKLNHDRAWNWKPSMEFSDYYGGFCLTMVLLSNRLFQLNIAKHETKIKEYLKHIKTNFTRFNKDTLTYGAFNALVLGEILGFSNAKEEIEYGINYLRDSLPRITDNQDSLALIGLSFYLKEISPDNQTAKALLKNLIENLLKSQNRQGFFETGDIRAYHHHRIMYPLWGLACASELVYKEEIRVSIEKTIQYVWDNRQDKSYDAFWWHPQAYFVKNRWGIPVPIAIPFTSQYFYECHQCFFVIAERIYQSFFKSERYAQYSLNALNWIWGKNPLSKNLLDISGIGLPVRVMEANGNLHILGEQFKGSYEMGSFICALAGMQDETPANKFVLK